jgi:SAM-dependent methyltransferase
MGLKKQLQKIFLWPLLPKERVNFYQEKIRRAEWEAVKPFIPENSWFLDVGCGAGHNLWLAKEELKCRVHGLDPDPGAHGVGRYSYRAADSLPVEKGVSEKLPYPDQSFDIVFSSHVLEHVNDVEQSLSEMSRVLKNNGRLIIGMPTATMGWIGLVTQLLLTTHIRWYEFFRAPRLQKIKFLFLPASHSAAGKTVLHDLVHYRVKCWSQPIGAAFVITRTLRPALYPYPDFRQLFRLRISKKLGSSVFFVCSKKQ